MGGDKGKAETGLSREREREGTSKHMRTHHMDRVQGRRGVRHPRAVVAAAAAADDGGGGRLGAVRRGSGAAGLGTRDRGGEEEARPRV